MKRVVSRRGRVVCGWMAVALLLAASGLASACSGSAALPKPAPEAKPPAPTAAAAPGGQPTAAPTARAEETRAKLRVGVLRSVSDAGLYIAQEAGYFEQQGIDAELIDFPNSPALVAPLGTGEIQVGAGGVTAGLLNAAAREIQLRIVADKGTNSPGHGYEALVIRKDLWDSGIQDIAGLKGRKISILGGQGGPTEAALHRALGTVGLTLKDVDPVPMPMPDTAAALTNRAIDAAILLEPFVTHLVAQNLGVVWQREDQFYPNHQLGVLLYSESFATAQADVASRFMTAYLQGVRDYNDAFGPKRDAAKREWVVRVFTQRTTVTDPALYDQMVMPGLDPDGKVNVDTIAEDQEFWLATGSQRERADLARIVDNRFREAALRQLGPYR